MIQVCKWQRTEHVYLPTTPARSGSSSRIPKLLKNSEVALGLSAGTSFVSWLAVDQHVLHRPFQLTVQSRTWFSGSELRGLGSKPLVGLTIEQAKRR